MEHRGGQGRPWRGQGWEANQGPRAGKGTAEPSLGGPGRLQAQELVQAWCHLAVTLSPDLSPLPPGPGSSRVVQACPLVQGHLPILLSPEPQLWGRVEQDQEAAGERGWPGAACWQTQPLSSGCSLTSRHKLGRVKIRPSSSGEITHFKYLQPLELKLNKKRT